MSLRPETLRAIIVGIACCVLVTAGGCKSSSGPSAGPADGGTVDGPLPDGKTMPIGQPPDCTTAGAPGTTPTSLPCACNNECASNFCVDGVCCESDCKDKCKSCALPSSRGQCALIPNGLPPTDPSECVVSNPSTCGLDGTCDGLGGCSYHERNTPCKAGTCDGTGITGQFVCNGAGACERASGTSCFPYSCDPATNDCTSSCSSNAQCAENRLCSMNSCGTSMNGAVCKANADCSSGFCTDGVCCNVECAGPCMACNLTGSRGRCDLLGAGKPDPAFCPVTSYTTCDTTGTCDGYGACSIYPANTLCGSPACAGDTAQNLPQICDGQGTCQEPDLIDCGPYRCANGACNTTCKSDNDCAPTHPCLFAAGALIGKCSGLLALGQKCGANAACAGQVDADGNETPGICADGVCCESACTGACRSCGLPGSLGRCVSAAAGAADPHKTCRDAGRASCGTDGLCDGTGACEKYKVDTECSGETCVGGAYTPAAKCNASGQCVTPSSRTCSPYQCSGTKCASSCTPTNETTQCQPPNGCVAGKCGLAPGGADCGAGNECMSGICAQGVCCNTACKGACMACNLTGSPGICTAVPDGRPDPQNICAATKSPTCGTTGMCKGGACAFWPSGQNCKGASCPTGTSSVTPASSCDGKGACVTPSNKSCGTFQCDRTNQNSCKSSCTVASQTTDCAGANTCGSNNSCGLKPPGAGCTAGNQCASSFCTEGVCCDSACTDAAGGAGLCRSCKVSGKVGTCSPVVSGGGDPRGRCTATNPTNGNCANDGTCNGAGACRPWSTATGCRQASCNGSTLTRAANCDGRGTCAAASPSMCNPFMCSATSPSCLTTCTTDSNCTGGLTCLKTTNSCGNALPPGSACKATNDCSTGVCSSEGVCCNNACAGACQSCTLTGKLGTCSPVNAGGTPRNATTCAATPGNVCGNTTRCDGSGNCQLASAGLVCGAAVCAPAVSGSVGGVTMSESLAVIPARTCNGAGTCTTPAAVSCGAFQCNVGATPDACKTTCTATNTDCNALTPPAGGGNSCVSGICQKKGNGLTCVNGSECVNGVCLDDGTTRKICCASNCTAQADACGTSGFCATNGGSCPRKLAAGATCQGSSCVQGTTGITAKTCSSGGTCTMGGTAMCPAGQTCNAGGACSNPGTGGSGSGGAGTGGRAGTGGSGTGGIRGTGGAGTGGIRGTGGAGTGGIRGTGGAGTGGIRGTGGAGTGGAGTGGIRGTGGAGTGGAGTGGRSGSGGAGTGGLLGSVDAGSRS